jgi:hypothetical protein
MNGADRRARTIFHAGNRLVALAVSACLLMLLGAGIGGVPALGRALVPGHGAWRSPSARGLSAATAARRLQSDDPASPWHAGLSSDWQPGTYLPMLAAGAGTAASALAISRQLRP